MERGPDAHVVSTQDSYAGWMDPSMPVSGRPSVYSADFDPPTSREPPKLISSLGALLRVSLRRSRADWPIVLAAGVMCTLAATLLAAGVMYGDAVSLASLHRTLADAPVDRA